jgi:hypothetical protein
VQADGRDIASRKVKLSAGQLDDGLLIYPELMPYPSSTCFLDPNTDVIVLKDLLL